jgi:hypothetical protein
MAIPTLLVGGVDVTAKLDLATLSLMGSGMADSETLDFDLVDAAGSLTVTENAAVSLTESGGAQTFGGFVQLVTPVPMAAVGRVIKVRCVSKGLLLDRLLVPSDSRTAESDYNRIVHLLSTYGTGLSTTYTSIATLNGSLPAQTFTNMSLRSALEAVAALADPAATFYVDATGKLHYYKTVPTAAPYAIKVGTPGGGEIAPETIEVARDAAGIVNAYYVQGANDIASGWVTDATSISAYGRREGYLHAPDADTTGKRDAYATAALAQTKDPIARGTFTTLSPNDGWAAEQTLTVTSAAHGLSGATFVIQKVTRRYLTGTGNRHYTVEFGGALPRFSSSNAAPSAIPGRLIAPGSLSITPFADTVRPVIIVGSLPSLPDPIYPLDCYVVLSTTHRLYKNVGGSWVLGVNGADIVADSITAAQIAAGAVSASEIAAGAITADKMLVGGIGTGNLMVNGSFEEADGDGHTVYQTSGTNLIGWTFSGSSSARFTASGYAKTGAYVAGVKGNGVTANPRLVQFVPVVAGRRYRLSGWVNKAVAGGASAYIYAHSADETKATVTSNVILAGPNAGTTQTHYNGEYDVPDDGTVSYLRIEIGMAGTPADTEVAVFEDVVLEPADLITADGDVAIDGSGITVTNGAITVTNAGATVIIDGSSNMFKIAATGTSSRTFPDGANTSATTTTQLTALGNGYSTPPAFLANVYGSGANFNTERWPSMIPAIYTTADTWACLGYTTIKVSSGYLVVTVGAANYALNLNGQTIYSRYYVLIEAGI